MPAVAFVIGLDLAFAAFVWCLPPLEVKSFSDGIRHYPPVGAAFFMCVVATMSLTLELARSRTALFLIWLSTVGFCGVVVWDDTKPEHVWFAVVSMVGPILLTWRQTGWGTWPMLFAVISLGCAGVSFLALPLFFGFCELGLILSLGWAWFSFLS